MEPSKKLIFFLLTLVNITISFNTAAIAAALPEIARDLQASDLLVSRLIPFYMIPYGLGALIYAPLARVLSYRRIFLIALVFYGLANLMSGITHALNIMLVSQIIAGASAACATPLGLMIIGEFYNKEVRGRLVGAYFGASFLASVVGMIVLAIYPWPLLFIIPTGLAAVTVAFLLFSNTRLIETRHNHSVNYLKIFDKGAIRDVFLLIFCMSFLYHGVHKWYGLYLSREYGLGKEMISFILIITATCGLFGQQIGGYLTDKKGRLATCRAGMLILSIAIMLLIGKYSLYILIIVLGHISIGWTISHNSVSTVLTDFPDMDRPLIASLNSAVRFLSGGLGFWMSQFLVRVDFSLTFFIFGFCMLLLIFYSNRVIAK